MPQLTFRHGVDYPDAGDVSLTDIANTLLAYEKLSPIIGMVLENLVDGATVTNVEFKLDRLEKGSLSEAFFVALFLSFQEGLEQEIPPMIEAITGQEIDSRFDTLVTILVLVLIFYGGRYLITRLTKKGEPEPKSEMIRGDYNTYINLAGATLNVPPEQVEQAVEKAVTGRRKMSAGRAAINFFRPAKRDGVGRIQPRNTPEISRDTVAEFPSEAALLDLAPDTDPEPFADVVVEVRATDRDWQRKGWYGIVREEGFPEVRASMILYPTVDADALAASERVRADILVEWDDTARDPRMKRFHVLKVSERLS